VSSQRVTREPASFDASVAHPARVYDFWLGGKDNYEADRTAGEQVIEANPSVPAGVRANRASTRWSPPSWPASAASPADPAGPYS
jgi:S-adenosyl methyltransferase